jgi:hypothetical protein
MKWKKSMEFNKNQKQNGFDIKVKITDSGILIQLKTNNLDNKDIYADKSEKGVELCLSEINNYLKNKVNFN